MATAVQTAAFVSAANSYAREVIAGKVAACHWVRLACQRQLDDLERWKGPKAKPYFFDRAAAERVCDIIERFPHIKGVWAQHRQRLVLEPWQCFILTTVFGWKYSATGTRRFRIVYIEVPRKNAKSTLTSAVGLYLTACDGEEGAHVVSAANTREQAKIIFSDAQHMARRTEGFRTRFGVEVLAHVIAQPGTASKFEALSSEHSNLDGLNIHAALIDEVHAHADRGLWDVLGSATGSRAQPMIWAITTAGFNQASVCYDQRAHVLQILQRNVEDDAMFGIVYTKDDPDDPFEEATWVKANPNYGVSIYPESLRIDSKRAMVIPSEQNNFLTKHLNVWVNAAIAWLPPGGWAKCADSTLDIEDFRGEACFIGMDLALRSDLAALVIAFPPKGQRDWWAVFGRYYLPEETVSRTENGHYQGWEAQGRLTATQGNTTDFQYILTDLGQLHRAYDVLEQAIDPYDAGPLVNDIQAAGLPKVTDVRQVPANMSPAMVELEGLVLDRRIRHDGDPVLAWMMSNVRVKRNAGELMSPIKEADDRKIDGVVALLMCLHRWIKQEYRTPGGVTALMMGDD